VNYNSRQVPGVAGSSTTNGAAIIQFRTVFGLRDQAGFAGGALGDHFVLAGLGVDGRRDGAGLRHRASTAAALALGVAVMAQNCQA
jgi:hypothetical protein